MTEKAHRRRRAPVVTAVPPGALESVLKDGLLSAQELAKRPELLQLARPDQSDRDAWLKRLASAEGNEWRMLPLRGPSVFFSPPPKAKITEDHYMRKWRLVPLKVDLDRLRKEDPSTRVHGVELSPGTDNHRRELTPEEVDTYRRTPAADLWKHYNDTRYYAANVPHAVVITDSGKIPAKYLRVMRRRPLEKTADKNNPGRITKMLKATKPNADGFAPLAYVKGTSKKSYVVGIQDGKSWRCTCPDWTYRASKAGASCKHIRAVQELGVKRGRKGFAKTAATRYDKEVARGNISYSDIAKRVPGLTVLDPRGADRSDIRRALEAPSTAPNLDRLRRIRELSVHPTARAANLRDGTVFELPHGPKAVEEGAYAQPIWEDATSGGNLTGKYRVHVPVMRDGTTRGTLDHEIAETRERRRAGLRPMATHDGTGPLVAERASVVGDPAAFGGVSKMRAGRGADPDDKLLWQKMKQMGATADRPMPMGGKAHRSLDRWVDRNADMLSSESRRRATLLAQDFGRGVTDPRDISPYLPKRIRELLVSHNSNPDSVWFDDPSHPKNHEMREIEDWELAKPRQQPMSLSRVLNSKPPSKGQLAEAMVGRSTAAGDKLRTLLRALHAGAL